MTKMLEVKDKPRRRDTRSRKERENHSLNFRRARRIKVAQDLFDEFDTRVKAYPPLLRDDVARMARTYQDLQAQVDEATAEPVL